jgi:hypothetical protein
MSRVAEQFLLDSNIFDKIVETPGAFRLVQRLVADGKIELVVTHIQEDELARITDEQKRQEIASVPRTVTPTAGFILDVSRLGMARLGDPVPIEAVRGGNWHKYTHDALIAAAALADGQVLVAEDRRFGGERKPSWA